MKYSLTINDLLFRPIIREDKMFEWMNKMTDEELEQWYSEVMDIQKEENKESDVSFVLTKEIDRSILYNLFKLSMN